MNYFLQYTRIEFKRAAMAFVSGLASLIIISTIVIGSAVALFALLQSLSVSNPISVAIASDDDSLPDFALRLARSMDSVKAVCEFELTDSESARKGLTEGKYGAAILLPGDFYNDVNTGINTPATMLVPKNMTGGIRNFGELLETGVSFIDTVEGGIYAVTDAGLIYGMKVSRQDMENYLTDIAFDTILKRTGIFSEEFDSTFDTAGLISYYVVCAFLLIILFSCTGFGYLYSKRSQSVEYNFKRIGLGHFKTGVVKFIIIFLQLSLLSALYILLLKLMLNIVSVTENDMIRGFAPQLESALISLNNIFYILPVLFSICGFVHFIFCLSHGREDAGLLLLILFVIMLIVGGCIVPSIFLPEQVRSFGTHFPVSMWRNGLFNGDVFKEMISGVVYYILGEVCVWAYTH
mgnify:CR=1 FL=1